MENDPPIVFLHGFGASSSHWRNNAGFFAAAGFRVYGLDLIGFGESDQPGVERFSTGLDNRLWARQLEAFLEEVVDVEKFGNAVLVCNSLGSLVAITTAVYRQELIEAVVVAPLPDPAFMNPVSISLPKFCLKIRNFLIKLFFNCLPLEILVFLIARSELIKYALQGAYTQDVKLDHELLQLVTKPSLRPTAARSLRAMCIGMSVRPKRLTAPKLIDALDKRNHRPPILMIWGQQDKLVPISLGKYLANTYPWIDFLILKNVGHCPHDECPQTFNQYVLNWLDLNLFSDRKNV